ncbi:DEAD-box ATP-dependent RNA helicase 40 [Linum perenne]
MATAESASAALGPAYAPEDPTLPKPWTGLIDRSTGLLYYWNPETNVTQYEKPPSAVPPPAAGSTPKLAQIPMPQSGQQTNGMAGGHGGQQAVQPSQQGQQFGQLHYQGQQPQGQQQQQMNASSQPGSQQHSSLQQGSGQPGSQQPGLQMGQVGQQQGQFRPQMMQHPGQPMFSHMGQQMHQPSGQPMSQQSGQPMHQPSGQPMPQQSGQPMQHQSGQPMPHQSGQPMPHQSSQPMPQQAGQHMVPNQSSQMPQPQGQFSYQPMQYMPYQQNMVPPPQQQYGSQIKPAMARPEEADQAGYPTSQYHPTGGSSAQNTPVGNKSLSVPPAGGHFNRGPQPTGPSGPDLSRQPPSQRQQNFTGPPGTHNQQPNVPPAGLKMGYENSAPSRASNDYYTNPKIGGSMMSPNQPNGAAMPMARNQQDARLGGAPFQNAGPPYSGSPGQTMHNVYSHANSSSQFPGSGMMMPQLNAPTDMTNLSPVDAYRQKHEVSTMGDNVPAPFMTFEDTGFPPEILRDVRYLLRRRSICRTLQCNWHTNTCNNCLI